MSYFNIQDTDWRLVWIIPEQAILGKNGTLLARFLMLYLFFMILAVAFAIEIAHVLLGRLFRLKDQMQKVTQSPPKEIQGETGEDEIGELMDAYNCMVKQIHELHRQEMETLHELNQMEFEAMRAQIDPHFLYNTLDMIRWMSQNGKQEDVEEAVKVLSRFYRLTTNKGSQWISVRNELEHVNLYVQLMNMRFGNSIDFLTDVSDEMMDYQIPALIFQPIVENAISHGIFEKEIQSGSVIITGWMDEKNLYFQISDDGIGIEAEILENLTRTEKEDDSGNGIGVYDTNRRLKLLYGESQSGLFYTSVPGEGTEVEYRIPKPGKVQR